MSHVIYLLSVKCKISYIYFIYFIKIKSNWLYEISKILSKAKCFNIFKFNSNMESVRSWNTEFNYIFKLAATLINPNQKPYFKHMYVCTFIFQPHQLIIVLVQLICLFILMVLKFSSRWQP